MSPGHVYQRCAVTKVTVTDPGACSALKRWIRPLAVFGGQGTWHVLGNCPNCQLNAGVVLDRVAETPECKLYMYHEMYTSVLWLSSVTAYPLVTRVMIYHVFVDTSFLENRKMSFYSMERSDRMTYWKSCNGNITCTYLYQQQTNPTPPPPPLTLDMYIDAFIIADGRIQSF